MVQASATHGPAVVTGAVRRTWWVKLRRAEKHLAEFNAEFERLRDTEQPYDVTTEVRAFSGVERLVVLGHLRPFSGDDDLAVVVGDIVANARDALDHIYVALTGRDDAHFPIFKSDIFQPDLDPKNGKDRNKPARDRLNADGQRMPPGALAIITSVQPYQAEPAFRELQTLATLQRLSNADKHRTLHVISQMMYDARTVLTVPPNEPLVYWDRRRSVLDGGHVGVFPVPPAGAEYTVQSGGGIEILLQEADGRRWQWELPESLNNMVHNIKRSVITPLDALII